jgi:hypothetical protein
VSGKGGYVAAGSALIRTIITLALVEQFLDGRAVVDCDDYGPVEHVTRQMELALA